MIARKMKAVNFAFEYLQLYSPSPIANEKNITLVFSEKTKKLGNSKMFMERELIKLICTDVLVSISRVVFRFIYE
jgi:hypothetical protein